MKIHQMTIEEIQQAYKQGSLRVKDVVEAYFKRIDRLEDKVGAFITLCRESALKQAEEMDARLAGGEDLGPLGGIPVAVKDNICTRGIRTTCASRMLEDFVPPYDATVVQKLKDAGAIILGKTNMDEFSMGSSTETSAVKITRNPWDLNKVPGGSSGGSAAAVGAGFAPLAIGSDTGGSVRQPAAFCGAVGLKPTFGRVSRYGLIALAASLDHIGPMTKTVKDCALAFQVLEGYDPQDSTSLQLQADENWMKDMDKGVQGLKIGVPKECFQQGLDDEIADSIAESIRLFEKMGAVVEELSLPVLDFGLSTYYIISSAEASSSLARYDGILYGYRSENFGDVDELIVNSRSEAFGKEVKRRIMLGTFVLSSGYYDAYYKKAMLLRKKIRGAFRELLQDYDMLLMPVSPVLPFGIGEKGKDPLDMYMSDTCTVAMNIAGVPALSLLCGFSKSGLPIGLQLVGDHFGESKLFRAAYSLERELGISDREPFLEEVE
ncbi:MAG: Asp-tRNA(Asn)/Glu-tRNA(Gln) amidotransferase subunit GatA [Clostridia bacterium]|jgi:aspartyl-tRNA(Asn)/glutamyl-tRNA(Gln) amidotransferase subunit A